VLPAGPASEELLGGRATGAWFLCHDGAGLRAVPYAAPSAAGGRATCSNSGAELANGTQLGEGELGGPATAGSLSEFAAVAAAQAGGACARRLLRAELGGGRARARAAAAAAGSEEEEGQSWGWRYVEGGLSSAMEQSCGSGGAAAPAAPALRGSAAADASDAPRQPGREEEAEGKEEEPGVLPVVLAALTSAAAVFAAARPRRSAPALARAQAAAAAAAAAAHKQRRRGWASAAAAGAAGAAAAATGALRVALERLSSEPGLLGGLQEAPGFEDPDSEGFMDARDAPPGPAACGPTGERRAGGPARPAPQARVPQQATHARKAQGESGGGGGGGGANSVGGAKLAPARGGGGAASSASAAVLVSAQAAPAAAATPSAGPFGILARWALRRAPGGASAPRAGRRLRGGADDAAARAALLRDNEQLVALAEQAHADRQASRAALRRLEAASAQQARTASEQLALLASQAAAARGAAAGAAVEARVAAAGAAVEARVAAAAAERVGCDQRALRAALLAVCDALLAAQPPVPADALPAGAAGGSSAEGCAMPAALPAALCQLRALAKLQEEAAAALGAAGGDLLIPCLSVRSGGSGSGSWDSVEKWDQGGPFQQPLPLTPVAARGGGGGSGGGAPTPLAAPPFTFPAVAGGGAGGGRLGVGGAPFAAGVTPEFCGLPRALRLSEDTAGSEHADIDDSGSESEGSAPAGAGRPLHAERPAAAAAP
jgi:hypothetical protein